jgi:hypothetical protein
MSLIRDIDVLPARHSTENDVTKWNNSKHFYHA